MLRFIFSFLLGLFLSSAARAEFQWAFESYLLGTNSQIAETDINPENQILQLPIFEAEFDLRGDMKWVTRKNKFIFRPRWTGISKVSENYATNERTTKAKGDADLTDFFVETSWAQKLTTTVGLQVYQWGPAELLSPSNPLYHFNSSQKSFLFKEKGQVLVRGNISFSRDDSLVIVVEPVSNNEPEWRSETEFSAKGLVKFEKSFANGSHYVGLVTGVEEEKNLFVGEYFTFTPVDGVSIYFDGKQTQNDSVYRPVFNGAAYDMVAVGDQNRWTTLATGGFRYEGDFDFRLEYVFNEIGYEREEIQKALLSAANILSPNYRLNIGRFVRPGLELLGRQYLYASVRVTDPFDISNWTFYARALYSLQDQSAQGQIESDYTFRENWTGLVSGTYGIGDINSEFKLLNDWRMALGLKASF